MRTRRCPQLRWHRHRLRQWRRRRQLRWHRHRLRQWRRRRLPRQHRRQQRHRQRQRPAPTMAPTPTRQIFVPEVTATPTEAPTMAPEREPVESRLLVAIPNPSYQYTMQHPQNQIDARIVPIYSHLVGHHPITNVQQPQLAESWSMEPGRQDIHMEPAARRSLLQKRRADRHRVQRQGPNPTPSASLPVW